MRTSARAAALGCCCHAALSVLSLVGIAPAAAQAKMLRWSPDHEEARWAPARQTPLGHMPSLGMKGLSLPAISGSPPRPTDPPRLLPRVGGGGGGLGRRSTANNTCAYVDGNPKDPLYCGVDEFCAYNSGNTHIGCCPDSTTSCPVWTTCIDSTDSSLFTTDNGLTLWCGSSSFPSCKTHIYQDSFVSGFTLLGCAVAAGTDDVFFSTTPTPTTTSVPSTSSTTTPTSTPTSVPAPSPPRANVGAIVGGVVGGVLFLLLLALLLFCTCRRRNRRVFKKSKTKNNKIVTTQQHHHHNHNTTNSIYDFYQIPPTRGRSRGGSGSARPLTGSSLASGTTQMSAYHQPHHPQYPAPAAFVVRTDGGGGHSPQGQSLGTAVVAKPAPPTPQVTRVLSHEGDDVRNNSRHDVYEQNQQAPPRYSSREFQRGDLGQQQRDPSPPSPVEGWGESGGGRGGGGLYRHDSRSRVVSELSTLRESVRESVEEIAELE